MSDPAPNCVLVVDDHAFTRRLIARMVRELGYDVLEAADGSQAIHLYGENANRIVAATLDLMMPETDGQAALAMLSHVAPFLPIVISSGLEPTEERLQGRVPGTPGVVYLQKPYQKAQLKEALDTVIGELGKR